MNRKCNQRADELLYILRKVVKDKVYEHLIILEKGPASSCINEIRKRHKNAKVELKDYTITAEGEGFVVNKDGENSYHVLELDTTCSCKLR